MKKVILITTLALVFVLPSLSFGQSNPNASFDSALNDILKSQNISQKSQIKCYKVTDEQFEKLGDGVMGFMHPDERQHELMDQMMGGEGSQSLKATHILMGERYLGCGSFTNIMGGMMTNGMMGGVMGEGRMNWQKTADNWGMMGMGGMMSGFNQFSAFGWPAGILMILFWSLAIIALIFLIKWLASQNKKQ